MPLPEEFSVEDLARAAAEPDRGGLTRAGRSLHKHGSRPGSVYPVPRGSAEAMNRLALEMVIAILVDPINEVKRRPHGRHGVVLDILSSSGRGLRYRENGAFINFLEPLSEGEES